MTEHKYAAILRAIADGKTIQVRVAGGGWANEGSGYVLRSLTDRLFNPDDFRIKPETITINGREVPKPESKAPAEGTTYFVVYLIGTSDDYLVLECDWRTAGIPNQAVLRRGLIHLTREAAQAHAEALLSFTPQEQP